jgi:hypothetical protein
MADSFGVQKGDKDKLELNDVEKVLYKYTELAIEGMKNELDIQGINASRDLWQSIRPKYRIVTEKFGITYIAEIYMEDYYEFVDKGREPGKNPPIGPIMKWMANKEGFKLRGLDKIGDIRERGLKKKQKYTMEDIVKANAFAISRGIGKKGTKATHFYSNVINQEFYTAMNKELSDALKRDVTVEIRNLVDTKGNLATGETRFK